MSFSYDVKCEIMSAQYKSSCCRRALLNGVLSAKGNASQKRVSFNTENAETAVFVTSFIKEFFGKDAEITPPPLGGRCKCVSFESKAAASYIEGIQNGTQKLFLPKCPLCRMAYFRGIFFACGRVTDPNKQFCLEFSLGNKINIFSDFFEMLGIELKLSKRGTETLLYTKNSSVIEDFFSMAELTRAAFEIMNVKIANDLKNNANRLRNFDTVNISKAVEAANAQITVIRKLYERNLLGSLPEELEATAMLRLQHPDMSLSQLAIHSVPPVSKSGITHRLKKIMSFGEELLKRYK